MTEKNDDKTTASKAAETKSTTTQSKTTETKTAPKTEAKSTETKTTASGSTEKPKTEAKEPPVTNETNFQAKVEKPEPSLANPAPTTGSVDGVIELNQRLSERSAEQSLKDAEAKAEADEKTRKRAAESQSRTSKDGEPDTFADIQRRFTLARQIDTTTGDPSEEVFKALVEPPTRFVSSEDEKK